MVGPIERYVNWKLLCTPPILISSVDKITVTKNPPPVPTTALSIFKKAAKNSHGVQIISLRRTAVAWMVREANLKV